MIQTYSHQNLQNSTLELFLPHFHDRAKLKHVANASPLNMGMLTTRGMPPWHPARRVPELVKGTESALQVAQDQGAKFEDAAVRFGMRDLRGCEGYARPPVVVGCADLSQVSICERSPSRIYAEDKLHRSTLLSRRTRLSSKREVAQTTLRTARWRVQSKRRIAKPVPRISGGRMGGARLICSISHNRMKQ